MDLKLSPKNQLIAVGAGAVVVCVLVGILLIKPQFSRIGQLRAEQKIEIDKLEENKLKLQRLDAIRQEAADIEAKRIALSRRLPSDAELPSIIVQLQSVANASGLDFGQITVSPPASKGGYSEIPINLIMTGTFYSAVDYLYRLEKMTREVVVDSFTLSPSEYPELNLAIRARLFKINSRTKAPQVPPPANTNAGNAGNAGEAPIMSQ